MKQIIKTLLLEGIDEAIIHKIIDIIQEGDNLRRAVDRAETAGKISHDKAYQLKDKAMAVPSTNDYHKDEKGNLDFSYFSGRPLTKNWKGKLKTDERHNRDKKILIAKRSKDEANNFALAKEKSIRRHEDKKFKQ